MKRIRNTVARFLQQIAVHCFPEQGAYWRAEVISSNLADINIKLANPILVETKPQF